MDISQQYCDALKASAYQKSTSATQRIHANLISSGLCSSTFLKNHLVNTYSSCGLSEEAFRVFLEIDYPNVFSWNTMINGFAGSGLMSEADKLFDEMPERDTVSWNSMMSGYFKNGRAEDVVRVFLMMFWDCYGVPDLFSFSCVMKAVATLGYLKIALQLHGLVQKFEYLGDTGVGSALVDLYMKCGALNNAEKVFLRIARPNLFCWNSMVYGYSKLYGVDMALNLFYQIPERDVVSWNTMISILSQHGIVDRTLDLFFEMFQERFIPNSMTYASIISLCASSGDLSWGTHLHARIIRMMPYLDEYMGSGLVNLYAKCGFLEYAKRVFNMLKEKNEVAWTSLIWGVSQFGSPVEAMEAFKRMREVSVPSDEYTLATVLGVCCSLEDKSMGELLHAYSFRIGVDSSVPVGNAIITMYDKCGNVQDADRAFDLMLVKDIISWTAIITALSRVGNAKKAREYFNEMPERNVITWNSMLATYIQNGFWEDGLKLFVQMCRLGSKPDRITFLTSLSACACLALLKLGEQIISTAEKCGFASHISVVNSIVTMYSRCGRIGDAQNVFDSILTKNTISWNAMMSGYAQSGYGRKVIEVFESMLQLGYKPDHISYLSVLSGCSHSGLLSEGQHYFSLMTESHGISPTSDHFTCMVDLFGRAGLLEKAENLIDEMPLEPNASVWGALLGACRIHGNTELAEVAMSHLINLGVADSGSYAIMSNMYSDYGKLEGLSDVRRSMRQKQIRKSPGCSWIEVNNRVHVFTVDDTCHPQTKEIYEKLDKLMEKIEDTGKYVYKLGFSGPKSCHSEKLAVAFGLMSLPSWMTVYIMKSLRICRDCHLLMKLISEATSRELVIRDAHRFHHFRDGSCSCEDYR